MSEVTVKQLAEVLGISLDQLMNQLKEANISARNADDAVSNEDKRQLLAYLRSSHGKDKKDQSPRKKVVLKRKSTGTLKVSSGTGIRAKTKTVNIEVRKKRTLNRPNKAELDDIAKDRLEAQNALAERKAQLAEEAGQKQKVEQEKLAQEQAIAEQAAEQSAKQAAELELEKAKELESVPQKENESQASEQEAEVPTAKVVKDPETLAKEQADKEREEQVERQVKAAVEKRKREKEKKNDCFFDLN
ncbi:MAG: translation initiation factor IF-2 associated domain-containing protein [Proteobacteria bacterium]|nr:translation initiation factor IF-2 associated domain-containing protein [Pseudomonadota bacterium]